MKQHVLVDTSSFIEYFRDSKESIVPQLAINDEIILSKIVRLELLKGTGKQDRTVLLNFLDGLFQIDEFPSSEVVEKLLLQLHGRGFNLGFADLLILADVVRTKSRLLTADKALRKAAIALKVLV